LELGGGGGGEKDAVHQALKQKKTEGKGDMWKNLTAGLGKEKAKNFQGELEVCCGMKGSEAK